MTRLIWRDRKSIQRYRRHFIRSQKLRLYSNIDCEVRSWVLFEHLERPSRDFRRRVAFSIPAVEMHSLGSRVPLNVYTPASNHILRCTALELVSVSFAVVTKGRHDGKGWVSDLRARV